MATVIPTSEEDSALAVVRFATELAWADAGPEVPFPLYYFLLHTRLILLMVSNFETQFLSNFTLVLLLGRKVLFLVLVFLFLLEFLFRQFADLDIEELIFLQIIGVY